MNFVLIILEHEGGHANIITVRAYFSVRICLRSETTLPPKVVEAAIRNVATRHAYGVSEEAVQGVSGGNCLTVPSVGSAVTSYFGYNACEPLKLIPFTIVLENQHLLIHRWEINDLDATLPKELKEAVEKRRAKREEVGFDCGSYGEFLLAGLCKYSYLSLK